MNKAKPQPQTETPPPCYDLTHAISERKQANQDYHALDRATKTACRRLHKANRAYARAAESHIAEGHSLPSVMIWEMTVAWLRHHHARDGKCPGCGENTEDRQGRTYNGFIEAYEGEETPAECPDCKALYYGYFVTYDLDTHEAVLTITPLINT